MTLGTYLTSLRLSLSLKWKLKVPTSYNIMFYKDEMKKKRKKKKQVKFSEYGNLCLLAPPAKYIWTWVLLLWITPQFKPYYWNSLTADYCNSLLLLLLNTASLHPLSRSISSHWINRSKYIFPIPIPTCLSFSRSKFQWSWKNRGWVWGWCSCSTLMF